MNVSTKGFKERTLIRYEIKRNGWLYWYWTPAYCPEIGRADCGYSGIAPDHDDFAPMKARLEAFQEAQS